jgi:hypothetical protein
MEVGKMPAQRKTNQSRRLTAAGLIAVTAATLLMMAWAIFPTAAFASAQSTPWDGKQGITNLPCTGGSTLWILAGFGNKADDVDNVVLHVDNQTATMVQNGNEFRATISGPGTTTPNAFATWDWNGSGDPPSPHLTISHCEGATTTPPPPEKGRIEIEKQTLPNGDPASFTFTGEINTTLGDGQSSVKDVDPGTYAVSEAALAGWTLTDITCNDDNSIDAGNTATFKVEAGETVRCVFTNTKDQTTTTPGGGGGGGGGGTTTTPPPAPTTTPIVAPTTIENTSTTATAEVLPTTVRPGKLAFTGIEDVVPIGALALTLMTTGSGLLWAGSRRRRHDGSEDED